MQNQCRLYFPYKDWAIYIQGDDDVVLIRGGHGWERKLEGGVGACDTHGKRVLMEFSCGICRLKYLFTLKFTFRSKCHGELCFSPQSWRSFRVRSQHKPETRRGPYFKPGQNSC